MALRISPTDKASCDEREFWASVWDIINCKKYVTADYTSVDLSPGRIRTQYDTSREVETVPHPTGAGFSFIHAHFDWEQCKCCTPIQHS
ncbi:hypothetical protein EGR_03878 [Echinococcus granulosus]|uniref:Uncharacterized protein n=1 Tax=Echinococcus granulosus TaxID=6210 RepID=W6UJI0_ECHGR|nr:hypothetical protein EGR_03878 [Echinococcus granulosus]EUB61203.1 hypothetical protein EGR_03878 [Echinococcus granulosus]